MFNILLYLENKRIKYNYQSVGPYKKYLENLAKFEKMSHLKNYFLIEIFLLNLKNIKKRREGIKYCRKIEKLMHSIDNALYIKYLNGILAFYREKYEGALEIFNDLFNKLYEFDSFIFDMNILIDLIEKELNIENKRDMIKYTIYGLELNFNSEMELKFFKGNKHMSDSLTFNKKLIASILEIKIQFEKMVEQIDAISKNKQLKILISKKFYVNILMKKLKNLNEFLDENFYERGDFINFCEKLENSENFIQLLYRFYKNDFSIREEIKCFDLTTVSTEFKNGFTFLQNNLNCVENITKSYLIKLLKDKFKKENFERKKKDPMPFLPIFYDLAYDYIEDMTDENIPNVKDLTI